MGAILAGLSVVALAGLLQSVLTTRLFEELRASASNPDFDFDAWNGRIKLYYQLFPMALAFGYGLMAFAMVRLSDVTRVMSARMLGCLGCAGLAFASLDNALSGFAMMGDGASADSLAEFTSGKSYQVVMALATGVGLGCVLLLLDRIAGVVGRTLSGGLRTLGWLWIAWEVGFWLVNVLIEPKIEMRHDAPWAYLALTRGVWMFGLAAFGVIAVRIMGALDNISNHAADDAHAAATGLPADPVDAERWTRVAAGLELYASALAWRIFATVGVYLMLFFAGISRSMDAAKFLAVTGPLISVITSIFMFAGIARYARQPDTSPAGGAAWLAGALMGFGVLMEFYGMFLILQLISPENASYRELRELAERAQSLSLWSMGVGFASLLTLLVSFAQLGGHMHQHKLVDRVMGTGIFFAIVAFLVLGFRSYATSAQVSDGGTLVVMGLAILVGALVALIAYLNLVNTMARAIHENQSDAELPSARVV